MFLIYLVMIFRSSISPYHARNVLSARTCPTSGAGVLFFFFFFFFFNIWWLFFFSLSFTIILFSVFLIYFFLIQIQFSKRPQHQDVSDERCGFFFFLFNIWCVCISFSRTIIVL